jgi:hypothetical protein
VIEASMRMTLGAQDPQLGVDDQQAGTVTPETSDKPSSAVSSSRKLGMRGNAVRSMDNGTNPGVLRCVMYRTLLAATVNQAATSSCGTLRPARRVRFYTQPVGIGD